MSRNTNEQPLTSSRTIGNTMLCVVAVMFCSIAKLLTCCLVYLCFGTAEVERPL